MNRKRAINLGIEALQDKMKVIAFEANAALQAPSTVGPTQKKMLEHYQEYTEAIKELERIRDTEQLSFDI